MASKVSIKKNKKTSNQYDVSFSGLTAGEVISIKYALETRARISSVASDVSDYLNNALTLQEPDLS